ncbi:MAG: tRNA (adenosine(37)-N6)-threonylcarbamoyltransferase complex ATPase subunit type 1 TsaE [Zoogloeaceae bacterium]|jgi:tRNA threonylcarbamoyladenosine biosynthesis protein TsaE|nr:tRNA (adenosine(37)-N6)-threonylcarbamoyltransferase complex ATPase subunit type 1 TsaE [Zoogloeaceae bacterium]
MRIVHGFSVFLADEAATQRAGQALAEVIAPGLSIWLIGDLGAGKTTLARALIRALGHEGAVKSPTYALVELYKVSRLYLYHFDFYRFNAPEEFVDAGFAECFRPDSVCLVEWPDKAQDCLPPPDLCLRLADENAGRRLFLSAGERPEGQQCLNALNSRLSGSNVAVF